MKNFFGLLALLLTVSGCGSTSNNPFAVKVIDGVPRLCKNGAPTVPLFFWRSPFDAAEVAEIGKLGIEVFTTVRSGEYFDHPYWVGENQYDFSWYDDLLENFFRANPNGYLIPRVFVCAPYWWVEANPDERVGFVNAPPLKKGPGGGTNFHESFASEKWKKEQGEALRALLRHFKESPYADRIIGIHIAGGTLGEWHYWSGGEEPDTSLPMQKRYGKPIPPPLERRADYYECFYSSTVDAIDHFCRIVKAEKSDWLTMVFYGYFYGGYTNVGRHLALQKLLQLDNVDIISSPHAYSRRTPGEDGYFRALPATLARHGKLLFDEADDRTMLGKIKISNGHRIKAESVEEGVNMLRREFGNMLTHCIGMHYMDVDGGNFNAPEYLAEISRAVKYSRRALALPWRRVSEIAVITDFAGRIHLPPQRYFDMTDEYALRELQFSQLLRIGAPFDLYAADDVDAETLKKYKMIIVLDGIALSKSAKAVLKEVQNNDRSFVWFYGAGAFDRESERFAAENIRDLTGLNISVLPSGPVPFFTNDLVWEDRPVSPGFAPAEKAGKFAGWNSYYFNGPRVPGAKLREIARNAGVFIYSDSDDVVSASESALMLVAKAAGKRKINLPKPKTVVDMVSGETVGEKIDHFEVEMKAGEVGLWELR